MSAPVNDGGPAFPRDHRNDGHNGMSLRDWFAGRAVESDIAEYRHTWSEERNVWVEKPREQAKYDYADAMIKAREKGQS